MALIFEVFVNGQLRAVAGEESLCVLSAHVTAAGKLGNQSKGIAHPRVGSGDISMHVGGLTSRGDRRRDEHLQWGRREQLNPGDEIRILVREGDDYAPATSRHATQSAPYSSAAARKKWMNARSLYFRMKPKFGGRDERETQRFTRRVIKANL